MDTEHADGRRFNWGRGFRVRLRALCPSVSDTHF